MKFNLDTDHYDEIKLTLSETDCENDLAEIIQDFCFGMASFFVDFAMQIECDTEKASSLKDVCLSCVGRNIDAILERGVLEDTEDEEVSEEELTDLENRLKAEGFNQEEIASITQLVKDCGSVDAATDFLASLLNNAGIDEDE